MRKAHSDEDQNDQTKIMNISQADEMLLSGEWSQTIQDIVDAMYRYRDHGPIRKHSLIYDLWTQRIEHLLEALEV